jgi:hypothetical protein
MKIHYTVNYSGVINIDNSEWDSQTKEDYENDLKSFVFVTVQEEVEAWQGLKIDSIEEKP